MSGPTDYTEDYSTSTYSYTLDTADSSSQLSEYYTGDDYTTGTTGDEYYSYDKTTLPHPSTVREQKGHSSKRGSRMAKSKADVRADKTPDLSSLMELSRAEENSRGPVEASASLRQKYRIIDNVPPAVSSEPEKSFISFTIAGTRRSLVDTYVNSPQAKAANLDKHLVLPFNPNLVAALLQRDRYRDPSVTLLNKFQYDVSHVTVTSVKLHTLSNRLGVPVHLKSKEPILNTVPVMTSFGADPTLNKIMGTLPAAEEIVDKCLYSLNADYLRSPSFFNYFGRSIGEKDVIPVADESRYGKRAVMAVRKSSHDRPSMFHHFARRNITEAESRHESIVSSDVEMEGGLYDIFDADELAKWQVKFMSVVKSVPTVKPADALTLALAPINAGMSWEQYVAENPDEHVSFSMTVCVHWIAPVKQENVVINVVAAAPSPSREDIAKAKLSDYQKRVAEAAKSEL